MNNIFKKMKAKSLNNLSEKKFNIKITINKINEISLKKKIQSSTSQTSEENPLILNRKIITKAKIPLSYFHKKYKSQDKQFFVSKTRRINKYNPNDLISKKELIIDTRSELFNNKNKFKKKKALDEYKDKNYQIYKIDYKIKDDKGTTNPSIKKINNMQMNKEDKNIYEEKENKNYLTQPGFYLQLNNNNLIKKLSQPQITNSLYTILAMKKNQFMDAYNDAKEKERDFLPKVKQLQFLMGKTPMANFYSKKKDVRTFISPSNSPLPYICLLNEDYSISEKIRFQKIMDKFGKLKKCLEDNTKDEFHIVKEFLLSIGLYDVENFYIEKLKKFIDFVKGNCLINPSKNIKENVLDIINGKTIVPPPISSIIMNDMNDKKPEITDEKLMEENQKIKNYFSDKNVQNDKDIVKIFKKNKTKIKIKHKEIKEDNNDIEKEKVNKINENPFSKKLKKSHRVESIERLMTKKYQEVERNNSYSNLTDKQKEIILNYRGLPINLKRQKEIIKSDNDVNLDLVSKPKLIIDMLEKKFKDEEKENYDMRAKTYSFWDKDLREGKNPKLYGGKRNNNDYEELKKRNMLTEYICLMKAKNNYEISKLKEKYQM